MYKREYEALLKTKKPPKASLFYGACSFQNNFLLHETLRVLDAQKDEKLSLYFDEYHFTTAKNFVSQSSLFGDRNILIVKSDKVIPLKELESLVELCSKNESSYFFYQYLDDDSKIKTASKAFDKKVDATFVRLFKADYNDAISMLMEEANKHALSISRYAMQHLYMVHMEDLSLCVNEFEKLALLGRDIQINDIDLHVYGLGTVTLDSFIAKLLDKKDIKEDIERMSLSDGHDEIKIINAIENYITQLFLFHAHIKLNGSFDAKAVLGYPLPPQLANQRSSQSIKLDLMMYKALLNLLLDAEFRLKKSSNLEKSAFLLSSLIKFQSYL
ncbi:MAG: DNA polymerase III subunit delta [Sulfurospirillaceae bacterium]|nr:DNA polymerase III subunit delta [Sulfurospirillaceae bacterium]